MNITRSDFKLNKDGYLTEINGDLVFVYNDDQLRQQVIQKLKVFKGEWFINRLEGLDYYEYILVKNPNISLIEASIRYAVLSVPGVYNIDYINLSFNNKTRTLKIDIKINGSIEILNEELAA